MSAPLSKDQKRYLAQLANRAFSRQRAIALGNGQPWDHEPEQWRHDQVAAAVGRAGLRCCGQDEYGDVKGHFLALLGQEGAALKAQVHGSPAANQRRVVEAKIVEELKALGKEMPYAMAICRRMYRGKGLWDVSTKDLWSVFYALRKESLRIKKRQKKEEDATRFPNQPAAGRAIQAHHLRLADCEIVHMEKALV